MAHDIPLGKLAGEDASRDAVHIAIAPVVAGTDLAPGTRVCILAHDGRAYPNEAPHSIGIVDPFITQIVKKGEGFYLCLFPGTITSLRHHWQHPAFEDEEEPEPSPPINWKYINDGSSEMVAALGANLTPNGPPWRTETVIGLCQRIRQTNPEDDWRKEDFRDILPILADALEESGFSDKDVLKQLRDGNYHRASAMMLTAQLLGGEYLDSVRWFEKVADRLPADGYYDEGRSLTAKDLLVAGYEYQKNDDYLVQRGGEGWRDYFTNGDNIEQFWHHYNVIMNVNVDKTDSFFSCSC